jgi:hypothetical protein
MFSDKKTGKRRPSGYEPGISIESLDAAKAIYRPIKYKFHDRDAEREEEDKKFSNEAGQQADRRGARLTERQREVYKRRPAGTDLSFLPVSERLRAVYPLDIHAPWIDRRRLLHTVSAVHLSSLPLACSDVIAGSSSTPGLFA